MALDNSTLDSNATLNYWGVVKISRKFIGFLSILVGLSLGACGLKEDPEADNTQNDRKSGESSRKKRAGQDDGQRKNENPPWNSWDFDFLSADIVVTESFGKAGYFQIFQDGLVVAEGEAPESSASPNRTTADFIRSLLAYGNSPDTNAQSYTHERRILNGAKKIAWQRHKHGSSKYNSAEIRKAKRESFELSEVLSKTVNQRRPLCVVVVARESVLNGILGIIKKNVENLDPIRPGTPIEISFDKGAFYLPDSTYIAYARRHFEETVSNRSSKWIRRFFIECSYAGKVVGWGAALEALGSDRVQLR